MRNDPPSEEEFRSSKAEGRPLRGGDPALWDSVSTWDDFALAARMARRFNQGTHLARLAIPPGSPVTWRQTGKRGHRSLSATPADILALVVEVVPVPAEEEAEQ